MKRYIPRFHYLTQDIEVYSHQELAYKACVAGCKLIQYRAKGLNFSEWKYQATLVKNAINEFDSILIINDSVEVCREIKADGVHLGKDDMHPIKARNLLGENYIIGCTANSLMDVVRLIEYPIDYIGLGPYKFTTTKANLSSELGNEGYKIIVDYMNKQPKKLPLIAIGGIKITDIEELMNLGVYGIAVSSAIHSMGKIEDNISSFLNKLL